MAVGTESMLKEWCARVALATPIENPMVQIKTFKNPPLRIKVQTMPIEAA